MIDTKIPRNGRRASPSGKASIPFVSPSSGHAAVLARLLAKAYRGLLNVMARAAHKPSSLVVRPMAAKEPRKGGEGAGTAVITRSRTQTKKPSMYRVLLLNDDYTPMEFVVAVLRKYFNKTADEATHIMLHVHHHGVGECGIFTYEVAETKVTQVMDFARKNQHPLQCIMEKK